jgi:ornithine cyclodeaminase/alanine dehydrogenase-like protein (mu-crystallin family)
LTLVLSENEVSGLLDMKEVVAAVEECLRKQGEGAAVNSPRTRSAVPGSVLNVMHASLPYLGRAGVKCYLSTRRGTRFVFVLFDLADAAPLCVMGADMLGRYRTGAASAVATKHLLGMKELELSVYGSGKQALTQVIAMTAIASLAKVRVWSPDRAHADAFTDRLRRLGFPASTAESVEDAGRGADVGSAITSSKEPFLSAKSVKDLRHLNLCGANVPDRAEATTDAIALFRTIAVDDLRQAKVEAGDLINAAQAGVFDWARAVELKDFVSGKAVARGPTLFKSGGVAIEDVAAASRIYDKAVKSGVYAESSVELGV